MKNQILFMLLLVSQLAVAQTSLTANIPTVGSIFYKDDCGILETMQPYEVVISSDTINYNPKGDPTWIYSEWQLERSYVTTLAYCPCCTKPTIEHVLRINDKGIIQDMQRVTERKYVPYPKSDFDKKLEVIKNRKSNQ